MAESEQTAMPGNVTDLVKNFFEPSVAASMVASPSFQVVCLASIAVSMKRLADITEMREIVVVSPSA